MGKGACCVAASVLLFLPLALWLHSAITVTPAQRAELAQDFARPDDCHPEPGERLAYLAGLVFFPGCLLALAFAWRRWGGRLPAVPGLAWAAEIILATGVIVFAWLCVLTERYLFLRHNLFFLHPLLAVPLLGVALAALWWDVGARRGVRLALHLAAAGLAVVVFAADLQDGRAPLLGLAHFTAVFYPVVEVCRGKALLIDCASQYGLYPHFLQPLFALTGLSAPGFTAVMGLLLAASFLALWLFLARAAENRTAAFLGFASLLLNGWFAFHAASGDPYYQYLPIRFVVPALLVSLAWRQLRRPTRRLYWGLFVFLSAGVLWNLDSGLPALLAWTAALCFGELFAGSWRDKARRVVAHTAAAGSVLAAVILLYSVAIRLAYGAFPDYGQFFAYQSLYFAAGFMKIPMEWPGTWALVALTYLAGLAYSAQALAAGRAAPRAQMVFLLSLLGIGLSSYFQGRSHPNVLLLVAWPCHLLLALFLSDLLTRLARRPTPIRPLPWLAAGALAWFLAGSAFGLVPELSRVGQSLGARRLAIRTSAVPPQEGARVALLERSVPPGEPVFIVSSDSALLHLTSGRPGFFSSTIFQMVRLDEFRDLERRLTQSPATRVMIDRAVFGLYPWAARNRGLRGLVDMLRDEYEVAAASDDCFVFARRPDGESLLGPDERRLFHVAVRDGALGDGLSFDPCRLQAPWSLEAVIRPAEEQVPYAAVVGNHPGKALGGFVLHLESPGSCALVAGDGRAWRRVVGFGVAPGKWNYITVTDDGETVIAYVNGVPAVSAPAAALEVEDSPLPLQIGNWLAGDRPFNGLIREVRILNRALASDEVAASAGRIRGKLP